MERVRNIVKIYHARRGVSWLQGGPVKSLSFIRVDLLVEWPRLMALCGLCEGDIFLAFVSKYTARTDGHTI